MRGGRDSAATATASGSAGAIDAGARKEARRQRTAELRQRQAGVADLLRAVTGLVDLARSGADIAAAEAVRQRVQDRDLRREHDGPREQQDSPETERLRTGHFASVALPRANAGGAAGVAVLGITIACSADTMTLQTPPRPPRPPARPRRRAPARLPIAPAWQLVIAVVLMLLLWELRYVALLCFAAIIAAAFLRGVAGPVARFTRWPARVAIVVVIVLLAALLVGAMSMMGQPLLLQLQELRNTVPRAWASVEQWLHTQPFGSQILSWTSDAADLKVPWARVAGAATAATAALADGLLVLLLGIYLAFDPALYRHGFLRLVPPPHRSRIGAALAASGGALQRWLLGQGLTMLIVGSTVGVGLALLGMPLAAAMGFIAGLLEFVPFFGAIASLLLGTLLAFAQGPQEALYVAIFFLVIQQLEGNVVIPLVQRWAAHLPPVLSLLAVVVFGTLFGVEGVILGTPLMVVLMVLTEKLYVQGRLGEPALRGAAASPRSVPTPPAAE